MRYRVMIGIAAVLFLVFQAGCASSREDKVYGLQFVDVPAGTFRMGADVSVAANNMPGREVVLTRGFKMAVTEVTNRQFAEMLNEAVAKGYIDMTKLADDFEKKTVMSKSADSQKLLDLDDDDCQIEYEGGLFVAHEGKEDCPVVEVSWYGAVFFCNMLSENNGMDKLYNIDDWTCEVYGKTGYRLPTEAEWEYAARYPDGRLYPWGDEEPGDKRANVNNVRGETSVVGSFSPAGDSALGLRDMSGNVAEWCNDWYDIYSGRSGEVDPVGPPQSPELWIPQVKKFWPLRVVRGGAWQYDLSYAAKPVPFRIDTIIHKESITTVARSFDYPTLTRPMLGFRVVKVQADGQVPAKVEPVMFKSVKYVAGPDGGWFTADDVIYHYFTYSFNEASRIIMTKCFASGPDGLPFTADDVVQSYDRHVLGAEGRVEAERSYDSAGSDGLWFTDDDVMRWEQFMEYDEGGMKVKMTRKKNGETVRVMTFEYEGGLKVKDCEYSGCGADGKWGTADDVIEKYHRFEYDSDGRLIRVMEYHEEHEGRGPDGEWFTDDDVISATMTCIYDERGRLVKELKAIGAGPDKEWFTDDDILQYYSVLVYSGM